MVCEYINILDIRRHGKWSSRNVAAPERQKVGSPDGTPFADTTQGMPRALSFFTPEPPLLKCIVLFRVVIWEGYCYGSMSTYFPVELLQEIHPASNERVDL